MNYWGSQLDRISNNLNMLFNNYDIDFDLILQRISNISFQENTFQIVPYPLFLDELERFYNVKVRIIDKIDKINFPCLIGDINKKNIWGRIEKNYFKQEIDFILFLEKKANNYLIYDSDISPYLLISKERLEKNISKKKIIIEVKDYNIKYLEEDIYIKNIKNIKRDILVGSNAYYNVANIVKNKSLTSKNELSLYYSIRDLSVLTYKMLKLSQKFRETRFISLLEYELELFSNLLNSLSKREEKNIIYYELLALGNNRVEMEDYFEA